MADVKIPGREVRAGTEVYVIAPLTLRQYRDSEDDLKRYWDPENTAVTVWDRVDIMVKVIALALKRNYPNFTEDRVRDEFDVSCAQEAFFAAIAAVPLPGSTPAPADGGEA